MGACQHGARNRRRAAENKAARRAMKTVWHSELFSDCCPTFSVKSVHRSQKALCEIQMRVQY